MSLWLMFKFHKAQKQLPGLHLVKVLKWMRQDIGPKLHNQELFNKMTKA